ncbi:MAG: hypothetical protein J0L62_15235 [Bacteroidetes bacterium]|nr:hypothetical protein [Bacteroidota bacterium]
MENQKALNYLAIILSILAIIFTQSQFRPLYSYLDKPKIEVSVDVNRMQLFHNYGHICLNQCVQVRNTGNASETVSIIYYYLEKLNEKSFQKLLTIQTTINFDHNINNQPIQYPVFDLYLIPTDFFNNNVMVYESLSKEKQGVISVLNDDIYNDIKRKKNSEYEDGLPVQVTDDLQTRVRVLVKRNMEGFTIGEYILLVFACDKNNEPIQPDKYYSFTVYESDIKKLNDITEDYISGGNNIYFVSKQKEFGFTTKLNVEKNSNELNLLIKRAEKHF